VAATGLNKITARATLVSVRAKGATPVELEALYRSGFQSFVRVATAITGDEEAGSDAVQAAFVAAVRARKSFRGAGTLEAWVWRIVVNEARRIAAAVPTLPLEAAADGIAMNGDAGDPSGVRRWVIALPPRQREAVFLRYFADLDYKTIARVLELEPGTVSATLSAAHQTLRKRLEAMPR
jgi:DNA-directed RNA polymerase specialized sigma24 family protein